MLHEESDGTSREEPITSRKRRPLNVIFSSSSDEDSPKRAQQKSDTVEKILQDFQYDESPPSPVEVSTDETMPTFKFRNKSVRTYGCRKRASSRLEPRLFDCDEEENKIDQSQKRHPRSATAPMTSDFESNFFNAYNKLFPAQNIESIFSDLDDDSCETFPPSKV